MTNQPPSAPEAQDRTASEAPSTASPCSIPGHSHVPVLLYKRTARVDWSGVIGAMPGGASNVPRGTVDSLSKKSARRLVTALADAPKDWGVMVTLTFRERVVDGRKVLKRWERALRTYALDSLQWAWVREYQQRGAVHYHWLWEREGLEQRGLLPEDAWRPVGKGAKKRIVNRGLLERVCVSSWMKAVGDTSEEFKRFQWGGIVERMADGDSASRYFGSYLAKHDQKTLPEGAGACGRWWAVSKSAKAEAPKRVWLTGWPFSVPFSQVFDKAKLDGMVSSDRPTETMPSDTRKYYAIHKDNRTGEQPSHFQRLLRMPMV